LHSSGRTETLAVLLGLVVVVGALVLLDGIFLIKILVGKLVLLLSEGT
jgi:hypothetical protein